MRNLKRALSLLLSSAMVLGMLVMGSSAASYTDVTSEENVEAIEVLKAVGVMTGDENGNFNPDKLVTRAEMAVVMANLLDLKVEDFKGAKIPFTDVPEWAVPYVAACYADGITAGISATQYGSNDSVTTAQAALMMMKALGYFQLDKDFGSDWQVATVKQGSKIDIFNGISAGASAAMTRNDVAQLALNTLKATMVETDGSNTTVTLPGGITIDSGDTKYVNVVKAGATAIDATETGDNNLPTVQLGEKLYDGQLSKSTGGAADVDKFGAPAVIWSYKDYEGTYAETPDYTVVVNKSGKDASYWAEEANKKLEGAGTGTKLNGGAFDSYQVGDVVNYYVADDGKTIEHTIVTRYTADVITDVDTDVKESDAEDGVTAYITFETAGTFNDTDIAGYNAKTFVEDAVVGMVEGNGEIIASYVASSVEGAISAYTSTAYTLDGTKYTLTGSADDEIAGSVDFKDGTYKLYLDPNGYVIKAEVVKGAATIGDVFYLANIANNHVYWVDTETVKGKVTNSYYVQAVYLDGTVKDIKVAEAEDNTDKNTQIVAYLNGLTAGFYTDNSKKVPYDTTKEYKVTLSAWANEDYSISGDLADGNLEIKSDTKKVGDSYLSKDTKYVVVESYDDNVKVSVKTGSISYADTASDDVRVISKDSNGSKVALYVVIASDSFTAAQAEDYIYVTADAKGANVDGGYSYTVYNKDGKEITIVEKDADAVAAPGFYTYTVDEDGLYTLSDSKIDDATTKYAEQYVSYYGDLLSSTNIVDFDTANAVIVDAHDTDSYNKSVTTLAAMQAAKKAGYIVTFDAIVNGSDKEVDYIVVTSVVYANNTVADAVTGGNAGVNGEFTVAPVIDGNNVTFKPTADDNYIAANGDGAVTKISGDLARYLGALYNVANAKTIVYNGETYTWNAEGGLVSSNWQLNGTGNTLVKDITDEWKAEHSNAWATGVTYTATLTVDGVRMTYTVVVPAAE